MVYLQHLTDILVWYRTLYSRDCNQTGRETKDDRADPITLTTEVVGSSLHLNIFDIKQPEDSLDRRNRRMHIELKLKLVHQKLLIVNKIKLGWILFETPAEMFKCVTSLLDFLSDVEACKQNLLWVVNENRLLQVESLKVCGSDAYEFYGFEL